MEEKVWGEEGVFNILRDSVVIISLYVDDRKRLLDEEQFVYKFKNGKIKNIKTIGDKWSTFQAINFSSASQPYYILLYPDGKIINSPIQYTDSETYYNWLKEGLYKFKTK